MIPQIIFTSILLIQALASAATSKSSIFVNIVATILVFSMQIGLLYWGGFYNCILK